MKLLIIRHAKTHRDSETGRDDERLLTARGERQAVFLARALAEISPRPDLLLCSPVLRAVQTAVLIQQELRCGLRLDRGLSTDTTVSRAMEVLGGTRAAEPGRAVLVLVGHNPTLESLIAHLTGSPVSALRTGEAVDLDEESANRWREVSRFRLDDGGD